MFSRHFLCSQRQLGQCSEPVGLVLNPRFALYLPNKLDQLPHFLVHKTELIIAPTIELWGLNKLIRGKQSVLVSGKHYVNFSMYFCNFRFKVESYITRYWNLSLPFLLHLGCIFAYGTASHLYLHVEGFSCFLSTLFLTTLPSGRILYGSFGEVTGARMDFSPLFES